MIVLYWLYRALCWVTGWAEYGMSEIHFWAYEKAFLIAKARERDEWPS